MHVCFSFMVQRSYSHPRVRVPLGVSKQFAGGLSNPNRKKHFYYFSLLKYPTNRSVVESKTEEKINYCKKTMQCCCTQKENINQNSHFILGGTILGKYVIWGYASTKRLITAGLMYLPLTIDEFHYSLGVRIFCNHASGKDVLKVKSLM
jgi:hypothetical protein